MQSDIVVGEDEITGTLKHVTEYTKFNESDPLEQEGNYLALSIESDDDATITTELVEGTKGPVEVDDGFCVYRIADNATQKVKITASKGESSKVVEYDLSKLTCNKE